MRRFTPRLALSLALVGGLAAGLALLSGCSSGNRAAGGTGAAATYAQAPAVTTAAAYDAPAPQGTPSGPGGVDAGRQIARTASVYVVVPDVAKAAEDLHALAGTLGGVVTTEALSLPGESDPSGGAGTVVLSVPADQLDAALVQIAALGKETSRKIDSTDVTEQVADVDARIETMRASIARLQELIGKSGSVTEIAAVESQLTQRQADLESLLAQQKSLSQRVATSPITIELRTPSTLDQPSGNGFVSALKDGWRSLGTAGRAALVVVGAALPWLALAALVAVPILLIRRHRRRNAPVPATTPWIQDPHARIPYPRTVPQPAAATSPTDAEPSAPTVG